MQMDSRKAELAFKRKQMAECRQRRHEKKMRHNELQAAQKSEAAIWAIVLEKNNMTSRDLLEIMELGRLTSRDVPYVDKTPLPPSEAETMQTVSYKDLYKRRKKPDALATAQTLSAPMSNLPVHPSPPAHSRLEKNNMTSRDLLEKMELGRLTSRDVPYVDKTPLPPSEAETMQTVSYKDLYNTFDSDSTSSFSLTSVTVSICILPALQPLPPLSITFPPPLLDFDFDRDQRDRSHDCDRNDRDRDRDCRKGKANGRRKEHSTFLAALHSNSTESSFIQAFTFLSQRMTRLGTTFLTQRMSRLGTTFVDKDAITPPTGSIQCQVILDTGSLAGDFTSG